ncbi:DUF6953 family protein [Bradyrhizobium sp. AUGA SZCCT0124]
MATPTDVADWMLAELLKREPDGFRQNDAAIAIQRRFGEAYVYRNANFNLAIDKLVLAAFRHLTRDTVVWDRERRHWRLRRPDDTPGKRQY